MSKFNFLVCLFTVISMQVLSQDSTKFFSYPSQNTSHYDRQNNVWTEIPEYVNLSMEDLAIKAEKNYKLQKVSCSLLAAGITSAFIVRPILSSSEDPMGYLNTIGGVLISAGSIGLLTVNLNNVKITFALTHPVKTQ